MRCTLTMALSAVAVPVLLLQLLLVVAMDSSAAAKAAAAPPASSDNDSPLALVLMDTLKFLYDLHTGESQNRINDDLERLQGDVLHEVERQERDFEAATVAAASPRGLSFSMLGNVAHQLLTGPRRPAEPSTAAEAASLAAADGGERVARDTVRRKGGSAEEQENAAGQHTAADRNGQDPDVSRAPSSIWKLDDAGRQITNVLFAFVELLGMIGRTIADAFNGFAASILPEPIVKNISEFLREYRDLYADSWLEMTEETLEKFISKEDLIFFFDNLAFAMRQRENVNFLRSWALGSSTSSRSQAR